MTRLHITGLCLILLALLVCGMTHACGDHFESLKEVSLVAIGAIAGDARSGSRERTAKFRVTGPQRTLEADRTSDEQ